MFSSGRGGNLIDDYYDRSLRLKGIAAGFLAGIIALLGAGVYVFVNASTFTASDVSLNLDPAIENNRAQTLVKTKDQSASAAKINADQHALHDEITKIASTFQASHKHSDCKIDSTATGFVLVQGAPSKEDATQSAKSFLDNWPVSDGVAYSLDANAFGSVPVCLTRGELKELLKRITDGQLKNFEPLIEDQKRHDALTEDIQFLGQVGAGLYQRKVAASVSSLGAGSDKKTEVSTNVGYALIQTSVTWFGTLAIISFLVSILIPLYRYNMKLAAFYIARGDALRLRKEGYLDMSLQRTTELLTPNYDFGRVPQTPIQQLVELLKAFRGDRT